MDGHPQSLRGSPTNPRMVTNQKEVYYRHKIWHLNLTKFTKRKPGNNFHGWSPTIPRMVTHQPRMVTHQKEVYYSLGILDLDLTHKTNLRIA